MKPNQNKKYYGALLQGLDPDSVASGASAHRGGARMIEDDDSTQPSFGKIVGMNSGVLSGPVGHSHSLCGKQV